MSLKSAIDQFALHLGHMMLRAMSMHAFCKIGSSSKHRQFADVTTIAMLCNVRTTVFFLNATCLDLVRKT